MKIFTSRGGIKSGWNFSELTFNLQFPKAKIQNIKFEIGGELFFSSKSMLRCRLENTILLDGQLKFGNECFSLYIFSYLNNPIYGPSI